jgi:methionyl-tRNA formyltransferase
MSKIVFVGAVELSYQALDELIKQDFKPDLVVTLHPDLSRRHSDFDDLGQLAQDHAIPVLFVNNINEPENMAQLEALEPDYILVIGWSQILKPALLDLPRKSCIGFHFAKLPRNRGRAAIPWVILNQESETGVTLMHLDDGVDSGDLVTQRTIPITPDETARTLYDKVCAGLRDMMREVVTLLRAGQVLPAMPQDHAQATYLAKRVANDGWIDWQLPAVDLERLVRAAGDPYPGAFTVYKDRKLIIWQVQLRPTCNHIGTIGQVLEHHEDAVTVQCGAGWLDLLVVEDDTTNGPVPATDYFTRVHDKLGIDPYQLWQQVQALVGKE